MTSRTATWTALVLLTLFTGAHAQASASQDGAPAQERVPEGQAAPQAPKIAPDQQLQTAQPVRAATVVQKPGDSTKPVVQKPAPDANAAVPKQANPNVRKEAPTKAAPNPRALARKIQDMEKRHRDVIARLERLREVFEQQGNADKVKELDLLRQQWMNRYQGAMNSFRQQLGPELFAKLQSLMDGRGPVPPAFLKGKRMAKPGAPNQPNPPAVPAQDEAATQRRGKG